MFTSVRGAITARGWRWTGRPARAAGPIGPSTGGAVQRQDPLSVISWRTLWLTPTLVALALLVGCTRAPAGKQYEVVGQIQAIHPETLEVVLKHGDIKGFMPAMTMPYTVGEASLLTGLQPGDLVTATLVVEEVKAYLSKISKTGSAPLPPQTEVTVTDGAVLQPGDLVPDQTLVDENGASLSTASLRGHRVALTFIFLSCPLPEFCPLMDRQFAEVQRAVKAAPALADVRLLSVSFDPQHDTAKDLKAHAQALGADPHVWSFVTATEKEIETLTRRFGVFIERDEQHPSEITHNLRTAIIDPQGRVVQIYSGTDWTPTQLVADLTAAPAPTH